MWILRKQVVLVLFLVLGIIEVAVVVSFETIVTQESHENALYARTSRQTQAQGHTFKDSF